MPSFEAFQRAFDLYFSLAGINRQHWRDERPDGVLSVVFAVVQSTPPSQVSRCSANSTIPWQE